MGTCVLRRSECVLSLGATFFQVLGAIFKKKLYGPFLWMGFNCLKATEPLRGVALLFTTKFPEIPGTHLIDLGRMKEFKGLGVTFCYLH